VFEFFHSGYEELRGGGGGGGVGREEKEIVIVSGGCSSSRLKRTTFDRGEGRMEEQ